MISFVTSSVLQRSIALLLLMAYTIVGTSALPAALVLIASLDEGHEVQIGQVEGGVRLTLHHRPDEYTPCLEDHRNTFARFLVSLSRAGGQGDHQITSSRFESNVEPDKKTLAHMVKQPVPVNLVATSKLEQFLADHARATSRLGTTPPAPDTVHVPAVRQVLSKVQMLV